jgi:mxaC protein
MNRVFLTLVVTAALAAGAPKAGEPVEVAENTGSGQKLDSATVERLLKLQDEQEVAVRLVLLPTSVEDKKGRIVTGLKAGDFTLTDESVPQQIKYFSVESAEPVSIAFVLDVSGSMRQSGKLDAAKEAVRFFVDQLRPQDRFALIVFSALPIPVLGFTQKQEVIQAAISAGNVGRGLSETNIGLALERALAMYEDRPYTGSRIVMLVSDGGDRIDLDTRERVAAAARKQRVAIYWLYLRSGNSPGLKPAEGDSPAAIESVPELMLNRFFESLETPYRAYEAGNSEALQQAIADVDRLENLPIAYLDLVPQRDLAPWCHGVALACVLLLLGASVKELRRWA